MGVTINKKSTTTEKNYSQNNFSLKKSIFAFLTQNKIEVKENGSKTLLNVCPLKCIYIDKNHFNFISIWSEIMSLKSDQLELGFSTFKLFIQNVWIFSICVIILSNRMIIYSTRMIIYSKPMIIYSTHMITYVKCMNIFSNYMMFFSKRIII